MQRDLKCSATCGCARVRVRVRALFKTALAAYSRIHVGVTFHTDRQTFQTDRQLGSGCWLGWLDMAGKAGWAMGGWVGWAGWVSWDGSVGLGWHV